MTKINITAAINNITENELSIIKMMFGDRIQITEVPKQRKSAKKEAPKKVETKPSNNQKVVEQQIAKESIKKEEEKSTRKDAINDWKIKKYGSLEIANAVQKMTAEVSKEWAEEARKTGKYVVSRKNYKEKLYAEAYLRVMIANKAPKNKIAEQKKIVEGLK